MMKTTRISYNLDNKNSFKIKIALMVAVIVCFIGGLTMTTESKQKANHDINKISVSVISIQLNNPVSGNQSLDLTCSIENKSKSTLNYVKADISFSDKSGALLGTIEKLSEVISDRQPPSTCSQKRQRNKQYASVKAQT